METTMTTTISSTEVPATPGPIFGQRLGEGVPYATLYMSRMKKKTALGLR